MDQIIPGLWIGDLPSALDSANLKRHGIGSILSAMRGRVNVHPTFIRTQIAIDDTENEDILIHFPPSIRFIGAELGKGRGVLVHCQAGISRSSTIVAAYLMHSRMLTPVQALHLMREARPHVNPNYGFWKQLEVFYRAGYTSSLSVTSVRRYYVNKVAHLQDGHNVEKINNILASFPPPNCSRGRRRIRCRVCRQALATREFMLDHGQVGPSTPRSESPAVGLEPVPSPPVDVGALTDDVAHTESTSSMPAMTEPPPLLVDPRCSGYFVEPLKWMAPFLNDGELHGKIICPNQRCKAKLGNYCRSKVDEVTV